MIKKLLTLCAYLFGAVVLGISAYFAYAWYSSRPTLDNFNRISKILWEQEISGKYGEAARPLCLQPALSPPPDAIKAGRAFAWFYDFRTDTTDVGPPVGRDRQLQQFEMLAKVGMLKRTAVAQIDTYGTHDMVRYGLSEKGWAASSYARESICFIYGRETFLGVESFQPIKPPGADVEAYLIRARVGLRSQDDLEPWAREPDIQQAFPSVGKSLQGQEVSFVLARDGLEWVPYRHLESERSQLKEAIAGPTALDIAKAKVEVWYAHLKHLGGRMPQTALPTQDQVRTVLKAKHGDGKDDAWPGNCLYLPGSEKLPVDRDLSDKYRYAVAYFIDKERSKYDRVMNKTLPYLSLLEQAGVLEKRRGSGLPGAGKHAGERFDAWVYELTTPYLGKNDTRIPYCLRIGEASVDFVDVQVLPPATTWDSPRFRYKLKVMYRKPPEWMKDTVLKAAWPEMAGVLDEGMACQGEFQYNMQTHESQAGTGSCWWAFSSYYDNG